MTRGRDAPRSHCSPASAKANPTRRRRRGRASACAAALVVAAAAATGCGSSGGLSTGTEAEGDGACARPYAPSSPWNTPLEGGTGEARAAPLAGELTSDPTQYTYPVYEVTERTTRVTVEISGWFSDVRDGGRSLTNQRRGVVELPIPDGARAAAGSDAQIILLDPATGDEWGVWQLREEGGAWAATNGYHYNTRWSGVPPRDADGRPFISRGAGVPYLAGLVRPCEIERGWIEHALAFAYDAPGPEYVYPATKSDGVGDEDDLPEGTRLQLDPALTEVEIQGWGCSGPCLTIARALQEYGMYVIDNSGRAKVMLEYEGTAQWGGRVDEDTVRPIPLDAFRVVPPPRQG